MVYTNMRTDTITRIKAMLEQVLDGEIKRAEIDLVGQGKITVYRAGTVVRIDLLPDADNPDMS